MERDDRATTGAGADPDPVWEISRDRGRRADAGAARAVSGVNVLLGLWLVLSPWLLRYSDEATATWNQVVVGSLVVLLAAVRATRPRSRPRVGWVTVGLGLWVAVSPFVLVEGAAAGDEPVYWNAVAAGLLVALLAAFSAAVTHVDRSATDDGS